MKNHVLLIAALSLALAGCSDGAKKTFGLEANPPDAFAVGTQAPLSLPPELGALPPPVPGAPRPQQTDAAQAGLDTLSPASSLAAPVTTTSTGQQALLDQAGPPPPAGIRAAVNQSALTAAPQPGLLGRLFGAAPPAPPTVDATAEQKRLQENAAMGQPAATGATPPAAPSDQNEPIINRLLNRL
jgi:hypothetical protein